MLDGRCGLDWRDARKEQPEQTAGETDAEGRSARIQLMRQRELAAWTQQA